MYNLDIPEVLSNLNTSPVSGLKDSEVYQLREKHGENRLNEVKPKTMLSRFLEQFKDTMIIILLIAAAVSFVVSISEGHEFFEPVLILIIVGLNATMGVVQEARAEKALDALKNLSAPHAKVIRDGKELIVEAWELVPGDIINLEAGDFVPADARLIESASLKSEESALTGESVPAEKDADTIIPEGATVGDRDNMVFSGCSITYGTATAVVTGTGMNTEMGKIANLLSGEVETKTPLQEKLHDLGKKLGFMALGACGIIFIIGVVNKLPIMEIFMTAVSLAVSAIPEGLPAIVTIVLSIGVQRMVKKNAIIRRLPAVETLGSASVICSDKTGTLTQNRMTLTHVFSDGKLSEMKALTDKDKDLLKYAVLCCDGAVTFNKDGTETHVGDPTETSIVFAGHKNALPKDKLNAKYKRVAEVPFDSDRKLMTTVNITDGAYTIITKGAFDMLATRCTSGDIEKGRIAVEEMSSKALRVLAVAIRKVDKMPQDISSEALEKDLTFIGLVGMIDPPRPEAKDAVAVCRKAGIIPVMITGDHITTASAIARELGILTDDKTAITGAELDKMSEDELAKQVLNIAVYARVSPENKIRIVKAFQKAGHVVSMTGDGVNDAPALKAADIGCAMGITGTDVAKGAADMTLTDDNFATIVDAVKEGRSIYSNIKKVVGFLLGTNIGEVVAVFIAMLVWNISPLLSMQLLFINLVTDSLPAIALGMEPIEEGVMDRKPKPRDEGLFAHGFGTRTILQGVMFGLLCLIAFYIGYSQVDLEAGRTMAFMTLAVSQIVQAYNMRSERSLFKIGAFKNPKLNQACFVSLALVALVMFSPLRVPFELTTLSTNHYLISLGLAIVPIFVMEIAKAAGLIKQTA